MSAVPSTIHATQDAPRPAPVASAAAPVAAAREPWLPERVQSVLLGVAFPIALVLLWHQLVVTSGTKLVPTPYQVGVMMWDFSLAASTTMPSAAPSSRTCWPPCSACMAVLRWRLRLVFRWA